jgi:L-asparaginase
LFFQKKSRKKLVVHKNLDTNVFVLKLFPGINEATLQSIIQIPNLKGIIVETYGAGNAPTDEWFIRALERAVANGLQVVNVTQCSGGSVNMGQYQTNVHVVAKCCGK